MRTVQLYVNDERLDLFKDEEIQVTSSIQNVSDISKVFTDFTQSFTVPASKRNNAIFKYYYESALDDGFEANVRADARIDIDETLFRKGRLQLESAETKENQVYAYKVTFYGEVTTLKDLFGEDKLADVTEINDEVTLQYSGANVQTSITSSADLDVRFPLISSSRTWTYDDAGAEDITLVGNAIEYQELFPAIKAAKIFDAIASKYSITFQGLFLNDNRFTKLFTWWKNRDTPQLTSARAYCVFPNDLGTTDNNGNSIPIPRPMGSSQINFVHNPNYPVSAQHKITMYTTPSNTSIQYQIFVFKNGTYLYSIDLTGNANTFVVGLTANSVGLNDTYTFMFGADAAITINGNIKYQLLYLNTLGLNSLAVDIQETLNTATLTTTNIDFASIAPDIKVADYFSGVLQMFNLTCYPVGDSTFEIEPLEAWYDSGRDLDITEFTDVKTITYERVKLHKRIQFNYKESKSFLNQQFKNLFSRAWGSLNNEFNYDGSELKVTPPFENIVFTNLDEARFQVAHSRTNTPPDDDVYTPAPVMLYLYDDDQTCDFYFDNGTTTPQITSYMPFGQDVIYNGEPHSLNFGEEISSLLLNPVSNSLYKDYYQTYLVNLFNIKNRKVYVTTRLPLGLLQDIELNDTLIIRDKKYIINEMKSNLITGQVDFVLLQDFTIDRGSIPPVFPPVVPPIFTGPVVVPIRPPKDKMVNIREGLKTFTTPSADLADDYTEDSTISFTLTKNTGSERTDYYYYDVYSSPNGPLEYTKIIFITQGAGTGFLLAEDSSFLLTEGLDYIIQE